MDMGLAGLINLAMLAMAAAVFFARGDSSAAADLGQVVMEGFLHRRIPVFLRRAVTMLPALVLLALGFSPTRALVLSQVALSFGIPFALIPLVAFTASRRLMGTLANRRATSVAAVAVTAVIVSLNVYLLATS